METTSAATSLFEGDNAAQAQWLNAHGARRNAEFEPYKRLMQAVFQHALEVVRRGNEIMTVAGPIFSKRRDVLYQEALSWVKDVKADGPFSFGSICEVLGFDPVATRKRVINGQLGRILRSLTVVAGAAKVGSPARNYDREWKRTRQKVMAIGLLAECRREL